MSTTTTTTTKRTTKAQRDAAADAVKALALPSYRLADGLVSLLSDAADPAKADAVMASVSAFERTTESDRVTRTLSAYVIVGAVAETRYVATRPTAADAPKADGITWSAVKAVLFPKDGATSFYGRDHQAVARAWKAFRHVTDERVSRRATLSAGLSDAHRTAMRSYYGPDAAQIVAWCAADADGRVRPDGQVTSGSNAGSDAATVVAKAETRAAADLTAKRVEFTAAKERVAKVTKAKATTATTIPTLDKFADLREAETADLIRTLDLIRAELTRRGVDGYALPADPDAA